MSLLATEQGSSIKKEMKVVPGLLGLTSVLSSLWSTNLRMPSCLRKQSGAVPECNPIPPGPSGNMQPPAPSPPVLACPETPSVSQPRIIWLQEKKKKSISSALDDPIPFTCLPKFLIWSWASSLVFSPQPEVSVQNPAAACSASPALLAQVLLLSLPHNYSFFHKG